MDWISVEDRLPDVSSKDEYLVLDGCRQDDYTTWLALFHGGKWVDSYSLEPIREVKYWAVIPDYPADTSEPKRKLSGEELAQIVIDRTLRRSESA